MQKTDYPIVTLSDLGLLSQRARTQSVKRQFLLDPSLDASISLTDEAFALLVLAQSIAPGKEISGLGYVNDGVIVWAGFAESGTGTSVTNNASNSAVLMAKCFASTGNPANIQIHTHPLMSCFWSGEDLASQHKIADDAADLAETGEMYFLVFSAHEDGIGIKYGLTRRMRWSGNNFTYNDGALCFRWHEFEAGKKSIATGVPVPKTIVPTTTKTATSTSTTGVPVDDKKNSKKIQYEEDYRVDWYESLEDCFFPTEDSLDVYVMLNAYYVNSSKLVPVLDALTVIWQLRDSDLAGVKIKKPNDDVVKNLDEAKNLSDFVEKFSQKAMPLEEVLWLSQEITKRKTGVYKNNRFWSCLTAFMAALDANNIEYQEYIQKEHIAFSLAAMLDKEDVAIVFPATARYMSTRLAVDLAGAMSNASGDIVHWLAKEANAYNSWFLYQVWSNISPDLRKKLPVASVRDGKPISNKAKALIAALDKSADEIYKAMMEVDWQDVLFLEANQSLHEKLEVIFTKMSNGLIFGEVWIDAVYCNDKHFPERARAIFESIQDKDEYLALASKMKAGE
jgi:hypothetical protein